MICTALVIWTEYCSTRLVVEAMRYEDENLVFSQQGLALIYIKCFLRHTRALSLCSM
jgi:hypothetical protein